MPNITIVAVSGSLHSPVEDHRPRPRDPRRLRHRPARRRGADLEVETHLIELSDIGREFSGALSRDELSPIAEDALRRIESATLLIVASPVYRASFTGLFKHVFDFVGQYALIDKPVLLAATGGSDRHALIIEHQFRPLFSFFQAITLPIGVYASDTDFTEYRIDSESLRERIEQAVARGRAGRSQYRGAGLRVRRDLVSERTPAITSLAEGGRSYAPDPRFAAAANVDAAFVDAAARRPARVLGARGRAPRVGRAVAHPARWRPTDAAAGDDPRGRRGSPAAVSTSPSTASTGTWRPATARRSPSTSRASAATAARSRTPSSSARSRAPRNALDALGIGAGRPRRRLPARAARDRRRHARRSPGIGAVHSLVFGGFSAEALRFRVADTGREAAHHERRAVPPRHGRRREGRRRRGRRRARAPSSTCSWSGAPATRRPTSRGPRAATCGGTRSSTRHPTVHDAESFDAETPALHHLHVGHDRAARRASCTRAAATSRTWRARSARCSTRSPTTCTGAPPTSRG